MRVFVTGATGFIGTELVKDLIAAGHQVRGLTRTDAGAEQLIAVGAEVHHGNMEDLDSLRRGAMGVDAVVNLAFDRDFSKFTQNGENERKAIEALGSVLEPGKLLIVTSGTGIPNSEPGQLRMESDSPATHQNLPRNPEQVAKAISERGVRVAVVRLPEVHDPHKQGLTPYMVQFARDKGLSAYVGDGSNRWPAAPVKDVAHLYRLAVEKTGDGYTVYHAVQEEGVPMRQIAETIGRGLNIPVKSLTQEEAANHFEWLAHYAGFDMPTSSEWTRKALSWNPTGPSLVEDLAKMKY